MLGGRYSLSILLALAPFQGLAKTCFAPDGSVADHSYQPCIAIDGVHSMCCSLNSTHPDTCQTNGLCLSSTESTFGENYWRDFCTDETWESPNCLSKTLCDKEAGGSSSWTSRLVQCDGGAYCCGTDKSCCLEGTTLTLASTLVHIGNTSVSTTTATATVTSKASGSSSVAIGVGVGAPLAVLALVMLGVGFLWGKRKAQAEYSTLGGSYNPGIHANGGRHVNSAFGQGDRGAIYEVDGHRLPSELPASKVPVPWIHSSA